MPELPPEDQAYIETINNTACNCGHAHSGVVQAPSGTVYFVIADKATITSLPLASHIELRGIAGMMLDAADEWELRDRRRRERDKAREN
jgi:hypothetical protein